MIAGMMGAARAAIHPIASFQGNEAKFKIQTSLYCKWWIPVAGALLYSQEIAFRVQEGCISSKAVAQLSALVIAYL